MPPSYCRQSRASTATTTGPLSNCCANSRQLVIQQQSWRWQCFLELAVLHWKGPGLQMQLRQGQFLSGEIPQFLRWQQTYFGELCCRQVGQQSITSCYDRVIMSSGAVVIVMFCSTRYCRATRLFTSNSNAAVTAKMCEASASRIFLIGGRKSDQSQQQLSQNSAISRQPLALAIDVTTLYSSWNSPSVILTKLLISSQQLVLSCLLLKMTSSCVRQKMKRLNRSCSGPYLEMQSCRYMEQGEGEMGEESQVAAVMASRLNPISKIIVMRRITVLVVLGSWLKRYRTPAIIITIKHNTPPDCL